MSRSFRTQHETAMQAAVLKQRQQQLRASTMEEKKEELSLFLEMRRREKDQLSNNNNNNNNNNLLNHSFDDFDAPLGSKLGTSPIFNLSPSTTTTPVRKTVAAADDFLNSESDKNDYDWLFTPHGTPLFPYLEIESQKTVMSKIGTPKARPTALRSRLANPQPESAARGNIAMNQPALSPGLNSTAIRRPSSSGGPGSRPSTPTGRSTSTASKPTRSSTPTSRATLHSSKPSVSASKTVTSAAKPATRTLTSSTKPTVSAARTPSHAAKPTVTARSSTPTRSTARSSTPTARPSIPSSKPVSRSATPTRRPSTPSSTNISDPPIKSSPSVTRSTLAASRSSVPTRGGTSPTVASRPWKPSEMPGFSLDAPPNLRTTLPDRPLSATRGRPGAPTARSSSVEPGPIGRPRRQSCSPSRGRPGGSVPAGNRGYSKASDNVSPVVIGNKMVERVVNMRKLAPPRQDDKHSHGNSSGKSASPDSSGFGRTLSKKSLDMAIRHMGIRRTIPGNLRPLMANIPASSMYSVRSGHTRSRTISVSDSPHATSSNGSLELSLNNNGFFLDGSEVEDEIGGGRVRRSPTSFHAR